MDSRFHERLADRGVQFGGGWGSALSAIVLAAVEYLAQMEGSNFFRRLEPQMELAIVAVIRRILLDGLERHPAEGVIQPEMAAAAGSWAVYGAAKEWAQTCGCGNAGEMARAVSPRSSPRSPTFQPATPRAQLPSQKLLYY